MALPPFPDADLREKALGLARRRFAAASYSGVSLRDLAAELGADPRHVLKVYRSKRGLFRAALEAALDMEPMLRMGHEDFGRAVVGDAMRRNVEHPASDGLRMVLRSSGEPEAARVVQEVVRERAIRPIEGWLGGSDAGLRAELLVTELLALTIHREAVAPQGVDPDRVLGFVPHFAGRLQSLVSG